MLYGYVATVLGYIWLVGISLTFLLLASYKYFQRKLKIKDSGDNNAEIINNDQSRLFVGCNNSPFNGALLGHNGNDRRIYKVVDTMNGDMKLIQRDGPQWK